MSKCGKYSCSDSVHIGEFKNGKCNGRGRLVYSNGKIYDGEFKDGKPVEGKIAK